MNLYSQNNKSLLDAQNVPKMEEILFQSSYTGKEIKYRTIKLSSNRSATTIDKNLLICDLKRHVQLSCKKWLYRNQNRFWKGISGTTEHLELKSHIIKQARNKQTPNCYFIIRPKKFVWWGWPLRNAKSVKVSPFISRNKNTCNQLLRKLCHIPQD